MINQGLKVKQYIEKESSPEVIVVKNEMFYDKDNDDYYYDIFDDLVFENRLNAKSFDDNSWLLIGEFNNSHTLNFSFAIKPEVNDMLKKYALIKYSIQNTTAINVQRAISNISEFIYETNFLNPDYLVNFRNSIKTWTDTKKSNIYYLKEFLRFSKIENCEIYFDVLNSTSTPKPKTRMLPSYQSIITFDYIIKDFIETATNEFKMKYYPILIWWELTKIIPLRPIELCLLERDWLKVRNNKYYLKIVRRKNKNGRIKYNTIPVLKEVEINEPLYIFIKDYIDYCNTINNSNYLFDYSVMSKYFEAHPKARINLDFTGTNYIYNVLKNFYNEVVTDIYGYSVLKKQDYDLELKNNEIETIQLGDTRHIAICSMMLQGFNELTIAQLAGHHTLSEQMGYCNHLDSYTKAYTYIMAKSFQDKIKINNKSITTTLNAKKMILNKALLGDEYSSLRKVDNGRCKSTNFPFDCDIDDCLFCPHFIGDENMSADILEEKLNIIEKEIETKLNYVKFVVSSETNRKTSNDLKTNTNSLNTMLKRKAIIQAYKMNLEDN